jgi:hypothetical protein
MFWEHHVLNKGLNEHFLLYQGYKPVQNPRFIVEESSVHILSIGVISKHESVYSWLLLN